jgi:hypothetical protein
MDTGEDRGRNWSAVATSQGKGKRQTTGSPLETGRSMVCPHLEFRLLASRTGREPVSLLEITHLVVKQMTDSSHIQVVLSSNSQCT